MFGLMNEHPHCLRNVLSSILVVQKKNICQFMCKPSNNYSVSYYSCYSVKRWSHLVKARKEVSLVSSPERCKASRISWNFQTKSGKRKLSFSCHSNQPAPTGTTRQRRVRWVIVTNHRHFQHSNPPETQTYRAQSYITHSTQLAQTTWPHIMSVHH